MNKNIFIVLRKVLAVLFIAMLVVSPFERVLAAPGFAGGAGGTLTVNSNLDNNSSDSVLTLREAILIATGGTGASGVARSLSVQEAAQTTCTFDGSRIITGGCGSGLSDLIQFDSAITSITLTANLPPLSDTATTTITGELASGYLTLDGANSFHGFLLQSSDNIIQMLNLTNMKDYAVQVPSSRNSLDHLVITNVAGSGIVVNGGSANTITTVFTGAQDTGPCTPGSITGSGIALTGVAKNNSLVDSMVRCSTQYGILLDGSGTSGNSIIGGSNSRVDSNKLDGIREQNGAAGNTWSQISVFTNGGLGIYKSSSAVAPAPQLTSVMPAGNENLINGIASPNSTIEVYLAASDPSGAGEGQLYLQSETTTNTGEWSALIPANIQQCLTAFQTVAAGNNMESSVFGTNICIQDVFNLTVNLSGGGTGSVTSSPAGIDCDGGGMGCSSPFNSGFVISLSAIPGVNSTFAGWGLPGASELVPDNPLDVSMDADQMVIAVFNKVQYMLTVDLAGMGSGNVTSMPAGIDCGAGPLACSASFDSGSSVELSAAPQAGSTFQGWDLSAGGALDTTNPIGLTIDQAQAVTAHFALTSQHQLSVSLPGTGSGTVVSSPAGINCGTTCWAMFALGAKVSLTASQAVNSTFDGWDLGAGGPLDTTNPIDVALNNNTTVKAVFTKVQYVLTVEKTGAGTGAVTGPGGIDCGSSCSGVFDSGASVQLSAVPAANSFFAGWDTGSGVSTDNPLTVLVTGVKTIKAQFAPKQTDLEVTLGVVRHSWSSFTFTVTVTNHSPYQIVGAQVTEAPLNFGASTWICAGAGAATCTVSGSGKLNDTITLPANTHVTYTVQYLLAHANTSYLYQVNASVPSGVIELNGKNDHQEYSGIVSTLVVIMKLP